LYFYFILSLRFSILWVTSSLILLIFTLNSSSSQFMVFSVSLLCLFRALMISFICFCVFSYSLFLFPWNFWVPPVCFGWPFLVTSLWNSHWLFAEFLLSGCSCVFCGVPCYNLSLFCWSLHLGIHCLYFPLNLVLIFLGRRMVSIPFLSSHHSIF
jgi:hypothetical protein